MGRFGKMPAVHHRKKVKARDQLKMLEEGKISDDKLNRTARKLLQKRFKAGYVFRGKVFTPGPQKSAQPPAPEPAKPEPEKQSGETVS